jgi:hypothetical protein
MSRPLNVLLCVAVLNSVVVRAQGQTQTQIQTQTQTQAEAQPSAAPAIDPTKLGVSFDRVRIQLTQPPPSKSQGLKIQETIEVVGTAPTTLLWNPKTVNLTSSAVPYGAPTQKDIMKLIVPKEFQNYPFDLNALMRWLTEHMNKNAE